MAHFEGLGEKVLTDACFDNLSCPIQIAGEIKLPLFRLSSVTVWWGKHWHG